MVELFLVVVEKRATCLTHDRSGAAAMNDLLEEFARMALDLHANDGVDETADRVLEYAVKAVGCDYAGLLFVHGRDRVESAAASHPVIAEIDALQVEHGDGPGLDVLEDRYGLIVPDTLTEKRWPEWAKRVAGHGIRSLMSVRMYTSATTVGTLNLYAEQPDSFDAEDQAVAHVLARHAAVALSRVLQVQNLWRAIDSRRLIGQAQGILMERYQLDADRAFAVLLRYSQDKNIKLRAVAEMLIDTRDLPE